MKYEIISEHPGIQAKYVEMRRAGESHKIAEMLAMRMTPGLAGTERSFFQGHCNDNQWCTGDNIKAGRRYKKMAKQAGVDTTGAVYLGQLADYPGDPKAWVKDTGDVKRVLKERNWSSTGAINVKSVEKPPPEDIPIAKDIVDRAVAMELRDNPGKITKIKEVREEVTDRLTPEWKKKK